MKKLGTVEKWLLTTGLIFLAFFILLGIFMFHQTMDLARGNSYTMEHLGENILWDLRQNLHYSTFFTLAVGQPVYWIYFAISKAREKKQKNVYMEDMREKRRKIWFILIPIISVIATLLILWLTMPLWFHLSF